MNAYIDVFLLAGIFWVGCVVFVAGLYVGAADRPVDGWDEALAELLAERVPR